jgi:hypothetical protein
VDVEVPANSKVEFDDARSSDGKWNLTAITIRPPVAAATSPERMETLAYA